MDKTNDADETQDRYAKVHFTLPEDYPVAGETLWASVVGEAQDAPPGAASQEPGGVYEVDNIPFFVSMAHGVNYKDRIHAASPESDPEAGLEYLSVATRSGHDSFAVVLADSSDTESLSARVSEIKELGCDAEAGMGPILAIDIPPHLEDYERDMVEQRLHEWQRKGFLAGD